MVFFIHSLRLLVLDCFFQKLQCFLYGKRYKQREGPFLVHIVPSYYLFLVTFGTVIVLNGSIRICFVVLCVKMDMLVLPQLIASTQSNRLVIFNISVCYCVRRVLSCVRTVYRPINMYYCNLINGVDRKSIY